VEQSIFDLILNKDTIFLGLFLYLLWVQQQEKKSQNDFILKQQDILGNLTGSFEKLADNQEKLTGRIERIEITLEKKWEGEDE
jgi:hypothetical protein